MGIRVRLQRRLDRPGFGRPLAERPLARRIAVREERDFEVRLRGGPARWTSFAGRFTVDGPTPRIAAGPRVEPNAPLLIRIVRAPYALEVGRGRRVAVLERAARSPRETLARAVRGAIADRDLARPRATRAAIERLVSRPRPFPKRRPQPDPKGRP